MKKTTTIFLLFLSAFMFQLSAQDYGTYYNQGLQVQYYVKGDLVIGATADLENKLGDRYIMTVSMINDGNVPVALDPANFKVTILNGDKKSKAAIIPAGRVKNSKKDIKGYADLRLRLIAANEDVEIKNNSTVSETPTKYSKATLKQTGYLTKQTVSPKEELNGYVFFNGNRNDELLVRITVEGHEYLFTWDFTKEKKQNKWTDDIYK